MRGEWAWLALMGLIAWAPSARAQVFVQPVAEGDVIHRSTLNPTLTAGQAHWQEVSLRAGGRAELGRHLHSELILGAAMSLGAAAPQVGWQVSPRAQRLLVAAERLAHGHLSVTLGRQGVRFGEGFILADGVSEPGQGVAGAEGLPLWPGAGQTLAPFDDFDGLHLDFHAAPVAAQLLIARLSATHRFAALGTTATSIGEGGGLLSEASWVDGAIVGGDVFLRPARWTVGLTSVVIAQRGWELRPAGRQFHVALRGATMEYGRWHVGGEVALQGGRLAETWVNGQLPETLEMRRQRSVAAYGEVRRMWRARAGQPSVSAGLFFYQGDNPDTPVDEAWQATLAPTVDLSRFTLGDIAGRLLTPNTDRLALRLGGEVTRGDHDLAARFYALSTHWGSSICEAQTGGPRCIDGGDGYGYTVGRLTPMAVEFDLIYRYRLPTSGAPRHGSIMAAALQPLTALTREVSPGGEPVVGDFPALALTVGLSAAF